MVTNKAMIVDDNIRMAEVLADMLEVFQVGTVTVQDAETALRSLNDEPFSLVITDLRMNGVGGMDILTKAKEVLPDAEVIVVTGHGTIESAVTAMQEGAFNYLLKPLDLKQLRAVVDKASSRLHLRRATSSSDHAATTSGSVRRIT